MTDNISPIRRREVGEQISTAIFVSTVVFIAGSPFVGFALGVAVRLFRWTAGI